MIGSTMRAAPSTMSSGGRKPCSAVLRSAICDGILVGHPAGVDAVHVDAVGVVVGGGGAGHHVQRRLGHVRVRVPRRLEAAVELALDRRDVDDVLVALGRAQHQRLQPRVEDERRDGVDELRLEQLDRRHLGEQQAPRVALAQVDLLQVLVEPSLREEVALADEVRPAAAAPARARPSVTPTPERRHVAPAGRISERRRPSYSPSSRSSCAGIGSADGGLALEHVPVEVGRPAHGLAGVVDDEVEPVARRSAGACRTPRRSACGAGRARRSRAGRPTPRSRARRA